MSDAEIRALVVGALIESPGGTLRVARKIHRYGNRVYVFCAIRRCSWTRRCYTLLDNQILRSYRLRKNEPRPLRSALDKRIARAMEKDQRGDMTCCDVVGVP